MLNLNIKHLQNTFFGRINPNAWIIEFNNDHYIVFTNYDSEYWESNNTSDWW